MKPPPFQLFLAAKREQIGDPVLQASVIRVLVMALNQTMTIIEDLSFYQVRGRIARYLLRCTPRISNHGLLRKLLSASGSNLTLGARA